MWSLLLLAVSCSNPSKTNAIIVATQPSDAHTLQAEKPLPRELERQFDYTPLLEAHDEELVDLLDEMESWKVAVHPADSLEGIDFPYLTVTLAEYTEPVLIFPYLDTSASGGYLTKIVVPFVLANWQDGYVIQHSLCSSTTALSIKNSFTSFVGTLKQWKTQRFPEFVAEEYFPEEVGQ